MAQGPQRRIEWDTKPLRDALTAASESLARLGAMLGEANPPAFESAPEFLPNEPNIAYLQFGSADNPPMKTERVKLAKRNVAQIGAGMTQSGYGKNLPTAWMVWLDDRWCVVNCWHTEDGRKTFYVRKRGTGPEMVRVNFAEE